MRDAVNQHIENSLNEIREFFVKAASKIESLKIGEKYPATTLAGDLAKDMLRPDGKSMTGPDVYPTLRFLLKNYPNAKISKGAHGGIELLQTVGTAVDNTQPSADNAVVQDAETQVSVNEQV